MKLRRWASSCEHLQLELGAANGVARGGRGASGAADAEAADEGASGDGSELGHQALEVVGAVAALAVEELEFRLGRGVALVHGAAHFAHLAVHAPDEE